jgi:hypothetical protein
MLFPIRIGMSIGMSLTKLSAFVHLGSQYSFRMRWSRDELLIVLNLYHKLPFGQVSARQPVVIDLAKRLGRTPASVSMKLGNLASFDPVLKLRGIRGLTGASILDKEMWEEHILRLTKRKRSIFPKMLCLPIKLFSLRIGPNSNFLRGQGLLPTGLNTKHTEG